MLGRGCGQTSNSWQRPFATGFNQLCNQQWREKISLENLIIFIFFSSVKESKDYQGQEFCKHSFENIKLGTRCTFQLVEI